MRGGAAGQHLSEHYQSITGMVCKTCGQLTREDIPIFQATYLN